MSGIQDEEELVDKILLSLRNAAPPDGMESRIVSALAHRAAVMPAPRRSPWKIVSWASSGVLASAVLGLLLTTHRKIPHFAVSPLPSVMMQAANEPVASPTVAKHDLSKPGRGPARISAAVTLPKEDLVAISYPAPPLPLTDQEKLLLQLAHRGDPVQLAMLDPLKREAQYADERAQVQIFFAPPPPQEITHEP